MADDAEFLKHVDSGKHVKVGDKLYITNGIDPIIKVDLSRFMTADQWQVKFLEALGKAGEVDAVAGYSDMQVTNALQAVSQNWIGPETIYSAGIDVTETEINYDKPGTRFGKEVKQ